MSDSKEMLEHLFLFDGKEFLVQKIPENQVPQDQPVYTILVREWRPDTWEFGTLYEVQVDKMLTCEQLANELH